jgi:hypothetical protein
MQLRAWLLGFGVAACCAQLGVLAGSRARAQAAPPTEARAQQPSSAPGALPPFSDVTASEPSLTSVIQVEPGAGCLEQRRLVANVKMWLGTRVSAGTQVRVHGEASRPRALIFDITRGDKTRRRSFDPSPDSCDDAHAVLGLAIALALDEEHTLQLLHEAEPARPPLRRASAQVSAAYGVLPDSSLGGQLGVELGMGAWLSVRLDLLAHYAWQNTIPDSQGEFDALLLAGSLQACAGGFLDAQVRLLLCTGLASGAIRASGRGYAPDASAVSAWLAVRSGFRIEARVGCRWLLDLEAISGIYSPSFEARRGPDETLTRRPDAAGIALSLGPAFAF